MASFPPPVTLPEVARTTLSPWLIVACFALRNIRFPGHQAQSKRFRILITLITLITLMTLISLIPLITLIPLIPLSDHPHTTHMRDHPHTTHMRDHPHSAHLGGDREATQLRDRGTCHTPAVPAAPTTSVWQVPLSVPHPNTPNTPNGPNAPNT